MNLSGPNISMITLNRLNILEIDMLKSVLGISYDRRKQSFKLEHPLSLPIVIKLFAELENTIWSRANMDLISRELEEVSPEKTRLFYYTPGFPSAIDGYLSKMGILDYEVLIEDPLCFPLTVRSDYKDWLPRNPTAYVQHMFEHAMSLIYLEDWIKSGFLYLVPSLTLLDKDAAWKLYDMAEKLDKSHNFEKTRGFKNAMRYSMAERGVKMSLEMMRLSKNHYTLAHIQKIFPGINDSEAKKKLDFIHSQSIEGREQAAIEYAFSHHVLQEWEKKAILDQFERTRPFNIERYFDISNVSQGLIQTTGMPLLMATYLSDRFQCIASSDNPGLIYGYEGWCEGVGQSMEPNFERVRSQVDLPFSYFDKLPLEFVMKARKEHKAAKVSTFLGEEWGKIRTSKDLNTYNASATSFGELVTSEVDDLTRAQKQMMDELYADLTKATVTGSLTCIATTLATSFLPLTVFTTVVSAISPLLDARKNYSSKMTDIESKPLAVFVQAEEASK